MLSITISSANIAIIILQVIERSVIFKKYNKKIYNEYNKYIYNLKTCLKGFQNILYRIVVFLYLTRKNILIKYYINII